MAQTDLDRWHERMDLMDQMLRDVQVGRAAATGRLRIGDATYARALEAARALKPLLEAKLVGQKAHHEGCLCPNCRGRGHSTIVAVEFPADTPDDRYKIGMSNWWKFVARHDDDGSEWRWTLEDTSSVASIVAFRQAFAGIDVPLYQPSPLFTADDPEPHKIVIEKIGFEFDPRTLMKDRTFVGSGTLIIVERDSPKIIKPTALIEPDGTPIAEPWVDAELSVENVTTEDGSESIALGCRLNRDKSQRWPDLFRRELRPVSEESVEHKWTFYFRCEERLWPLARVVAFDADSVTVELDSTVKMGWLLN